MTVQASLQEDRHTGGGIDPRIARLKQRYHTAPYEICMWCHNIEGKSFDPEFSFNKKQCIARTVNYKACKIGSLCNERRCAHRAYCDAGSNGPCVKLLFHILIKVYQTLL